MSGDDHIGAQTQEVTSVRLLVLGAVQHGADAAHRKQGLGGEGGGGGGRRESADKPGNRKTPHHS